MLSKTNKIAINSISLYANMLVSMAVTLLGTRFALQALGKEDYAVYALIANIVALFSFINVAMAASTQRFMSFYMGKGSKAGTSEAFYNSIVIHTTIAAISVGILLAIGVPAVEHWLDIPAQTRASALIVLLCMAGGVTFTVLSVPFEGAMNAYEDIFMIAGINILDVTIKLMAAIAILFIPSNRLTIYAFMIMGASLFAFICKVAYCRKHYDETHFTWHKITDFGLIKKMTSFAGWNLIGTGCSIARFQGAAVLLNSFFGLLYNAAYGVAQQVNGFLLFFANSVVRPMRPHIIKSEGAGRHSDAIKYSYSTSRFTTLMLAVAIIPLFINMPYILQIWLKEIPTGTLEFCRGFLIITLIAQASIGQQIALESVGKIKRQHLTVGIMHILPLPAALIMYKCGIPYYGIIYCIIVEEILCIFIRTYIAKKDADMPIKPFIKGHLIPCTTCIAATYIATAFLTSGITNPLAKLVAGILLCATLLGVQSFTFCFTKWEKEKIYSLFRSILSRKL